MTRPIAGGEALLEWLSTGWGLRLFRLGVLLFALLLALVLLLVWAVGAAVLAVLFLRLHGDPRVAIFFGALFVMWTVVPAMSTWVALTRKGTREMVDSRLHRWSGRLFFGCAAVAWFAALAALLHQGDVTGFLVAAAFTAIIPVIFIGGVLQRRYVSVDPLALHKSGLVLIHERDGRYTLRGIGTLRVDVLWLTATGLASGVCWRFAGSGPWSFRENATATDAAGSVIGEYCGRGRVLRWGGRELRFRRASLWPTLGWRALVAGRKRYVLADGEWTLAEVHQEMGRSHRRVTIELDDSVALEKGLLLFVAFLVGWLDMRDRNNDGV